MVIRFIRLLLYLFVPSPLPDASGADLFHVLSSGQGTTVEFNNNRPKTIEGEIIWDNEAMTDNGPIGATFDGPTLHFRMAQYHHSSKVTYYCDEDGKTRPVRLDRSGLADTMLEELAAEYLRAKTDAEGALEALERDLIAALRDTYGRELWRRAQNGAESGHVSGRDYRIVPHDDGFVELILTA